MTSYFVNVNTMTKHGELNLNSVRIAKQNLVPNKVELTRVVISKLWYVSSYNNAIDITYDDGAGGITNLTGLITPGTYSQEELVEEFNKQFSTMLVGGVQVMTCVLTAGSFEFYDSSDKIADPLGFVTFNKCTSLLLVAFGAVELYSFTGQVIAVTGTILGRGAVQRMNESKMGMLVINELNSNGAFGILTEGPSGLLEMTNGGSVDVVGRVETITIRLFTDRYNDNEIQLYETTKTMNNADLFAGGLGINMLLKVTV